MEPKIRWAQACARRVGKFANPLNYKGVARTVRTAVMLLVVIVIFFSAVLPVVSEYFKNRQYRLSSQTKSLIGIANVNLAHKLSYDTTKQAYIFNKAGLNAAPAVTKDPGDPTAALKQLQAQVGGAGKQDKSLYSVELPNDASKGITYHDNNLGLSFSVVPQFRQAGGNKVDDRIIYPVANRAQAIYTAKSNGIKEDLILPSFQNDKLSFAYQLKLPDELEARLRPDGSLGIYSADLSLFGNITYGSTTDQATVMKARQISEKNNLVFAIPAPIIKQTGTAQGSAKADFFLDGNTLTIKTANLRTIPSSNYPISIDPSVVITSSSDFASGNNEGGIDYSTSGQINRGGLTGGSLASWAATTSFSTARSAHASVAYNGYLYIIGGVGASNQNDVQYAPINSNGTTGTWNPTTSFTTARSGHTSVAYNGYLYIIGGTGGGYLNDVQYAPINGDGTIGSWNATTSFTTARYGHTSVAYNGFLYIIGGFGGSYQSDVQYAPINADGTVGSWVTSIALTAARFGHASMAYNGYIYVAGGYDGTAYKNDVQYTSINPDGTIGGWNTTTSFSNLRRLHSAVINNGYMYVIGGADSTTSYSDVQYAPVYANGTTGIWRTTSSIATARSSQSSVVYNGYLYITGGLHATSDTACDAAVTTYCSDVQYAQIAAPGTTGSWASSTSFTTARYAHESVAYKGFLYVIGGSDGSTELSDVQYAPISSTGTIGTWTATTSFTTARYGLAAVAYDGFLYVMGGGHSTSDTACSASADFYCSSVLYAPIVANGTIGTWTATTSFATPRAYLSAVTYNGNLYIMGGQHATSDTSCSGTASSYCSDVQYAPINANGTIGTWTATTSFATPRYEHSSLIYNGYLYLIGGTNGTAQNDVQYAPINSNGTIGTWNTTTSLSSARYGQTAVTYNGMLYLMGGNDGSYENDVQYAIINSNGTIGTWNTLASFTTGRFEHSSVAYNGFLYIIGGGHGTVDTSCNGTASSNCSDVEYAPINNGGSGTLGTWSANTALAIARNGHTSVAYNGYIYVIGGEHATSDTGCNATASTYCSNVLYATISVYGSIGTWNTTSSFTTPRQGHTSVVYNGYLYVIGGYTGGYLNDVQYAPINANGTIGTWNTTTSFSPARYGHSSVAYNGYLYIIGGAHATTDTLCSSLSQQVCSDVQYAPINANGTIGTWNTTTSIINGARGFSGVTTYNGFLYLTGGNNVKGDVQYAPFNSNGTLGAWLSTTNMYPARSGHTAVAYNGYLYIIGGGIASASTKCNASSSLFCSDTMYAPINANGTIGSWTFAPTAFANARDAHTSVAYSGYLYIIGGIGGATGTTRFSSVLYTPITVMPRTAKYSKLIDLGSATNSVSGLSYGGTLPGGYANLSYRTAGSNGIFGASQTASSIGGVGAVCPTNTPGSTRYIWISALLNDSQGGAVYPDSLSPTAANLTDLTINYTAGAHPSPQQRLRGGKTLQSSVLSSLDTCVDG